MSTLLPASSVEFYTTPPKTSRIILLTIVLVVLMILILAVVLLLAARYQKPCQGAPVKPLNVQAGYVDNTTFRVLWDPQRDISGYAVYIGTNVDFTRVQAAKVVQTNKSSADVTELDRNKTYYIFVTAKNACGESVNSDVIAFVFISS